MGNPGVSDRKRNSRRTRKRLLAAAFHEMWRVGFRASELDRILADAGVTKGALYHHFEGKRALGYAVVDEVLREWILQRWLVPVAQSVDPLEALIELAAWGQRRVTTGALARGCPLAMLSQELSGTDEGFRRRLAAIYREWQQGLAAGLERARREGRLRQDVDPHAASAFIVASWRGSIGLAKAHRGSTTLAQCREGLETYLRTLRP